MSGTYTPAGSNTYTQFDPKILTQLMGNMGNIQSGTDQFAQQANQSAGQLQTDFSGNGLQNTPYNANFQSPTKLDDFGNALVSQGMEQQFNQNQTANTAAMQRFGSGNPNLVGILGQQADSRSAGANNSLPFQAGLQQYNRQIQNQGLTNAASMAQSQQGANLQQLTNSGIAQRLGFQQAGLGAQQNLMGILGALGSLTGTKTSTPIADGSTPAAGTTGAPGMNIPTPVAPSKPYDPNSGWNPSQWANLYPGSK